MNTWFKQWSTSQVYCLNCGVCIFLKFAEKREECPACQGLIKPLLGSFNFKHLDFTIDFDSKDVFYAGQQVRLTQREYLILEALCKNMGRVLSVVQLIDASESNGADDIKVYIKRVREKMHPSVIRNVRSMGYIVDKPK